MATRIELDLEDSPDEVVQFTARLLSNSPLLPTDKLPAPRLLVKERWHRIHIVFDLFNDDYDSNTAHLPNLNDLPVIAVFLGESLGVDQNKSSKATSSLQKEVNRTIRDLHDWNGHGSQPPFVTDHANGNVPTYPNPRTIIRAGKRSL
ncbi:hypothetical protein F4802DRAFT_613872 [Xylaria palmicola]|nr:hypothetical protein F4802DRAFT_613872 [Xylaria palmicola]